MAKEQNTNPVIFDEARARAVLSLVPFFEVMGATQIRARVLGHEAPEVIKGTVEPHRPDLTLVQGNRERTGMLVEVLLNPEELDDNRISLFGSAASSYGWDFVFAVSSTVPGAEAKLRNRLKRMGLTPQAVYVL
jgi:hypothetical protein